MLRNKLKGGRNLRICICMNLNYDSQLRRILEKASNDTRDHGKEKKALAETEKETETETETEKEKESVLLIPR